MRTFSMLVVTHMTFLSDHEIDLPPQAGLGVDARGGRNREEEFA
jgi:hypothetical protein